LGMDAAFDRLRRYCRGRNLRLAEVARHLAAGQLDPATITTPAPQPEPTTPAGSTAATMPVADFSPIALGSWPKLERSAARSATIIGDDVSPALPASTARGAALIATPRADPAR
jgi:hypothetical protein